VTRAILALFAGLLIAAAPHAFAADKLKALIIDGQNNHHWQETTPALQKILEDSGLFVVTVATAPPGPDMSAFQPDFAAFNVVVSNYNGLPWPDATKAAFEKFVRDGGGFVSYHAADNAFPNWAAYNEMTGVGGWAGRTTEKSGSMVHFRDGQVVLDSQPKACGHHGDRLPFQVTVRDPDHPITRGLPAVWMHPPDELYDSLCGPAKDVGVLATAHSDPNNKGTGENEPMLMVIRYGKGRVFHTTLGHDVAAMQCVGFITTLQRGAEWAASGKVTQKVPDDFPTADRVSLRK
jgi:type 1 glutamine amidotransferase